jgi:glycosyltransferase involved in cell wall biosynthesis
MLVRDLFVVVPFYNEAPGITTTLDALAGQSDGDFALVLVDNSSTDRTAEVAMAWAAEHPNLRLELISEPEKGTGAASDTGFRHAISRGARFIARTDADCVPHRDWIRNIRRAFEHDGLELVIGQIKPRVDDHPPSPTDAFVLPVLLWVAEHFGRLHRGGPQFKYPYIMVAGNNMAITASMYLLAGGFPRTRIEQQHEDRVLGDSVRRLTVRTRKRDDVVVYNSTRRLRAYGRINTLLWYWDHKYRPAEVDIR